MSLVLMYITNDLEVAKIAQKSGVDRIWIDLETLGKEERQKGLNTVKSKHSIDDIRIIAPELSTSEMLVRVNPWNSGSRDEINQVIDAGADIIMLPMWKSPIEIEHFLKAVAGRCKTTLLLETKEAVECIDDVLEIGGFDEIHIGLNDLHLSYGMTFMFELLADGTVEKLCKKFGMKGIPYGFGGIAKLGSGLLSSEKVIMEHYRLGSTRAILSRSFCDSSKIENIEEFERVFKDNMKSLRQYERSISSVTNSVFVKNKGDVTRIVSDIVDAIKFSNSNAK